MTRLRRILWQRLDAEMSSALGRDWTQRKIVLSCDRPEVLEPVTREHERLGLRRMDVIVLNDVEQGRAFQQIRGGNWVETAESRAGGEPTAFGVFLGPAV